MLHSSLPYHKRPRNACLIVCSPTAYHYREAIAAEGTKRKEAEAEQRAAAKTAKHHEPNNRGFSEPTRLDHGKDPQTLPPSLTHSHSRTRSSLSQLTQSSSDHTHTLSLFCSTQPLRPRTRTSPAPRSGLSTKNTSLAISFGIFSVRARLSYLTISHLATAPGDHGEPLI